MKIFPVVHINEVSMAVRQAELALEHGADGIYLIDHNAYFNEGLLFETFKQFRDNEPSAYIGVNMLGFSAMRAMGAIVRGVASESLPGSPNALWIDDIRNSGMDLDKFLSANSESFKSGSETLRDIRILGGICFKYTRTFSEDPAFVAEEVKKLADKVDVITTSGSATGSEPSVDKMQAARSASGGKPVAVASGISSENIHKYAGLVDEVLAASSIEVGEKYSGLFDVPKLKDLIVAAHEIER